MPKTIPVLELHRAIVAAARGEAIDRRISEIRALTLPRPPSPREADILRLIGGGASDIAVAGELGISDRTVETHLGHLFKRYDVRSRTQLVLLAERNDWLRSRLTWPAVGDFAARPGSGAVPLITLKLKLDRHPGKNGL